jgi:hypothetical protein
MISQILGAVMLIYLLVAILFLMAELWSSPKLQAAGRIMLWLGLGTHTGALLGRWVDSYRLALGHSPSALLLEKLRLITLQAPLANFYESLIFFSWCLPALGLLAFRRYLKGYLGALVAMLSTLLLAYASFGVDSRIKPLMPALKSNWLLIHVVTAFLGYAAFALAFGSALIYLFQERRPRPSLPPPALAGQPHLPHHRPGISAAVPGDFYRCGVGRNRLGPLLELGPQGNLVPDHLVHLRRPAPRPAPERLAWPPHRLAGGPGFYGGLVHLLRRQLPPHRPPLLSHLKKQGAENGEILNPWGGMEMWSW